MPTTKAKKTQRKAKEKAPASEAKKGAAAKKAKPAPRDRSSKNGKRSSRKSSKSSSAPEGKVATKAKKAPENGESRGPSARRPAPADKRQLVQERKILRSQSRWLQKALFALGKAEDDQTKLAEVRGDRHQPMAVTIDGTTHQVGDVTDSLRVSVMDRLEGLRVTLRNEHSLMG